MSFFSATVEPRLRGCFPEDDYVLDFALELEAGAGPEGVMSSDTLHVGQIKRVWVVEVNPFFDTTDACLFSWSKDTALLLNHGAGQAAGLSSSPDGTGGVAVREQELAAGGEAGAGERGPLPEFRFRRQVAKGASSLMYGEWRDIITDGAT